MSNKAIKFLNEDEVMKHYQADKENNQVIIFEGVVYDVKEYAPNHPGGEEYLLDRLGTNIEEDFEDAEHTKLARNNLKELPVVGSIGSDDNASTDSQGSNQGKKGSSVPGATTLYGIKFDDKVNSRLDFDYTKTLYPQIHNANFTFEEYVTYINEPKHFVNPVRDLVLFDNWFLETVSQAPWYYIPTSYFPWMVYACYNMYYVNFSYNPILMILTTCLGILTWSWLEYVLHRFLFHGEDYWMPYMPHNKYLFTAHFFTHGIHHAFP